MKVIVILSFLFTVRGYASHYSPGVMEEVIGNRIVPGRTWMDLELPLPITDGYIAVPDCRDIGEVWYLRPTSHGEWESFLVVDCADPTSPDPGWMDQYNIIVEVDHKTAQRWNTLDEWLFIERRVNGYIWAVLDPWKVTTFINQPMYRRYK